MIAALIALAIVVTLIVIFGDVVKFFSGKREVDIGPLGCPVGGKCPGPDKSVCCMNRGQCSDAGD